MEINKTLADMSIRSQGQKLRSTVKRQEDYDDSRSDASYMSS